MITQYIWWTSNIIIIITKKIIEINRCTIAKRLNQSHIQKQRNVHKTIEIFESILQVKGRGLDSMGKTHSSVCIVPQDYQDTCGISREAQLSGLGSVRKKDGAQQTLKELDETNFGTNASGGAAASRDTYGENKIMFILMINWQVKVAICQKNFFFVFLTFLIISE